MLTGVSGGPVSFGNTTAPLAKSHLTWTRHTHCIYYLLLYMHKNRWPSFPQLRHVYCPNLQNFDNTGLPYFNPTPNRSSTPQNTKPTVHGTPTRWFLSSSLGCLSESFFFSLRLLKDLRWTHSTILNSLYHTAAIATLYHHTPHSLSLRVTYGVMNTFIFIPVHEIIRSCYSLTLALFESIIYLYLAMHGGLRHLELSILQKLPTDMTSGLCLE